jgi:hypothetical protein
VKFNDRDLLVVLLIIVISSIFGAVDVIAELHPASNDGVLDAALMAVIAFFFYKVGKNGGS